MPFAGVRFGDFTLDPGSRQIVCRGVPVHLSRKAFDALCVLVERRPGAVTKEELHARLWPDTFVVDANLSVVVAEIRRALADDPHAPRFIRTVHRFGYAFCADAQELAAAGVRRTASSPWLVWNDRILPLAEGENVVGRDPGCGVWLDERGVSRRHACIRVAGTTATIEDLGSKNGTFLGEAPVAGPRRLADGDRLRLGPVAADFRQGPSSRATETIRLQGRVE
jgi:DNA-binding winged helix-turn-helix (wHTH) protein